MDIYERLKSNKPKQYQEIMEGIARFGDPEEILAYINAMPICCPEGEGILHLEQEVRIDDRFLVLCYKKNFGFFPVDQIKFFYVSAESMGRYYDFGVWVWNQNWGFKVDPRYARDLYEKLLALCPEYFRPSSNTTPINLQDYRYSYVTIDSQNVTLCKYKLFNKVKTVLAIPVSKIRSCYQTYDVDSDGDMYDLYLRMYDGTEHRIGVYKNLDGFRIARRIKAVVPELVYEFPVKKK